MFFKRRKQNKPQVYEVYVVGRPSPYSDVVKVIGVTRTKEEAYEMCTEYVKRVCGEYDMDVHYWDDCINIRVELATGIIRSYTFNVSRHELR